MHERMPWVEAVAPARERFGPLITAASRWHDDRGAEVSADVLAMVCAASLPYGDDGPEADLAPLLWTRPGVQRLLWAGFCNWCTLHNAETWPLEVVPATWQWLDFLHHTGRLDPRSDPLWELRKPLICYGGLGFDGRWRPEDDPSPIPCECHLPYRETVDYLNRRLESGELYGTSVFIPGADDPETAGGAARVGGRWTSERRGGVSRAASRAASRARPTSRAARRTRRTRPAPNDPG